MTWHEKINYRLPLFSLISVFLLPSSASFNFSFFAWAVDFQKKNGVPKTKMDKDNNILCIYLYCLRIVSGRLETRDLINMQIQYITVSFWWACLANEFNWENYEWKTILFYSKLCCHHFKILLSEFRFNTSKGETKRYRSVR